jgi:hypothetical protein
MPGLWSKIHDVLAAPYPFGDTEMHTGTSIGISGIVTSAKYRPLLSRFGSA